jgi:hypothetical protein
MSKVIYSDAENKRWWEGLGKTGQAELFDRIIETATSTLYVAAVNSMKARWEKGQDPSVSALISLRKWAA